MLDAYLVRYGGQDIHRLRGLDRPLTQREKLILRACLDVLLDAEVQPLPFQG
jgi:hypothetical protein